MAELNLPSQSWLPVAKHKSAAAVVLSGEGLNIAAIQELRQAASGRSYRRIGSSR